MPNRTADPLRKPATLPTITLLAALCGLATPTWAQDDQVPERKRWWEDFGTNVLVPLGDWSVYRKDGLRIDNDLLRTRLKLNASFFGDAGQVGLNDELDGAFPGQAGGHAALTQARLTLLGWVFDKGMFKIQLEFAERPQIKDSWFQLNPRPYLGLVKLGNMKEPFSLGGLVSSADRTYMTDALPVLAFAPGRNIGIMANNTLLQGDVTWAFGGFWNTGSYSDFAGAKDAFSNSIGFDVTGRVTWLPNYSEGGRALTHLGVSLSLQSFSGEVQFRAVPETSLIDAYFADTGLLQPDRATLLALEFAEVRGPWSVQAEVFVDKLTAPALDNPLLKGFYVSGSHILTGEHRLYDRATGVFDGVIPKQDFSWTHGGWGAFEVALRLSTLDLNDGALAGGRQRDLTAAFNWYLNPHTRLMVNFVHGLVNGRINPPPVDGGKVNIVQARLQVRF